MTRWGDGPVNERLPLGHQLLGLDGQDDDVSQGKFHIYPVRTIDDGVEILTGIEAGERQADGKFPAGTLNALVDKEFDRLAEGLKRYTSADEKEKGKERS